MMGTSWAVFGGRPGALFCTWGLVLGRERKLLETQRPESENIGNPAGICVFMRSQLWPDQRPESENIGNHAGFRIFMRSQLLPDKTRSFTVVFMVWRAQGGVIINRE